jgi:hypothetical protein
VSNHPEVRDEKSQKPIAMKYLLFLFALLMTLNTFAQRDFTIQSDKAFVYKLTNEQALVLAKKENYEKELAVLKQLQTPFDTLDFTKTKIPHNYYNLKYPVGHYVVVRASGEYLDYQFLSFNDIGVVPIEHKNKFQFYIVDTVGQFVKADKVMLDDKELKQKKGKYFYEKNKFDNKRLLIIQKGEQLVFYEANRNNYSYDDNWFVRKWHRITDWNIWYNPLYALNNTWRRIYLPFKYQWETKTYGYITTNKPKYLPQDTVKIKAYLTRDNKVAYNSPLTIKITNYGNFKFEKEIKPISKGSYIFEFPLGDSLQLDRQYQVEIWKGKKQLIQTYFKYEDYQLDEISYNLRSEKTGFKRYEPIILYAEGKDKNGQNVMDGDVEITAIVSNVRAFYDKIVLVPDTLFHYKGALELGGEMRFPLPKETIPMADFSVFVKAVFTNSNGELHEKTLNFDVISDSTLIDLRLDGDTLLVDYRVNGKSVPAIGKLSFGLKSSQFIVEKTVQLPYKEVLNPVFEYIRASANGNNNILNFNGYSTDLLKAPTFNLVQTGDSVFVFAYNPSGLEVNYEIYRINRKIEKNSSNEKSIVWQDKARGKMSYRIDYEYIINGKGVQNSQNFNYAENQLTINIDQPNVVQPGETIDIKVTVKTAKNRDAKNVNLVAGAVNTQFENTNNWKYDVPFIGETSKDKPKQNYYYNNSTYLISPFRFPLRQDTITEKYRKAFDLDRFIYFKLLFADKGYYEENWNIKSDSTHAQFAPLVVKNGVFERIHLVYANRELVYYRDTETPYSFKGRAGYNIITIRGEDFELVLDSVYLKAGEKLVFSIDLNDLPKNATVFPRENKWTSAEKALLQKTIFTYRRAAGYPTPTYVWQNDNIYPSNGQKTEMNFGPFTSVDNLKMIKKNQFQTEFKFEPGFIYEIEKTRERLYQNTKFPHDRTTQLGVINPYSHSISDTILFNKNIAVFDAKATTPLKIQEFLSIVTEKKYQANYGKTAYQIQRNINEQIDSTVYCFILHNEKTNKNYLFRNHEITFKNIPKGKYSFYGYTQWGYYFKKEVEIRNDTLFYEYIESVDFQSDTSLFELKSLFNIIKQNTIGATNDSRTQGTYSASNGNSVIRGIAYDESTGAPLMFATVILKKENIVISGAQTDFDGKYQFNNVDAGTYDIEVAYVGYQSKTFQGVVVLEGKSLTFNSYLSQGVELDEIVVAYYVPLIEQDNTTQGMVVETASMTITALGKRDIQKTPAMLGQVAGVSLANKEEELTISGSRSDDTDFYIDGIAVADTLNFGELQASSKIRSRFQDYAFWQPNLITDNNGEATFRVTYPDNITAYQTFVLGMDRKQNFGIATKNVQSKKVALAQLAVPRFLLQGDKVNVIGKSLNYSNDSLRIKSTFLLDENPLKTNTFWLKNLQVETAEIVANTDKDTLQLTYKMEHVKFFDGEKRPIPIYKKGTEETVGSFNILTGDTTVTLTFDKEKGNVKIYAQTDILEVLLNDVQYLMDYPYGCNEQTASRLMALLMNAQIKKMTVADFENSKEAEKNKEAILKMVKRLDESQNPDGSWGWWRGNEKNFWMTNYVLKALHAADTSSYKSVRYEIGLRFLTNSLSEMRGTDLLNAIELLSDIRQNMDYKKYITALDTQIVQKDIYNQLILTKIKQQQGLPYSLAVLDSLEKSTLFGNIFYDIDRSKMVWAYGYRYWYANHYNLTVLAYQILKNENENENAGKLAAIRGYFLEKRTRYGWQNTFTTAQILSTILPDMVDEKGQMLLKRPTLVIKGNTTETVTEFPFATTFYANTPLEIQKTGTSTVYLTGYQQFWNEKPKPKNDIFELKTELKQNDKTVKKLTAKMPTKMVVTLDVKKEAEYVMVEVPIPAGCSYGEKSGHYGWYGREVYREYFREKTCIFYQNLPVGTYTIEINLEPRFTGEFTVNPAKAEQMYFPVFYGRNAMKEVEIEE